MLSSINLQLISGMPSFNHMGFLLTVMVLYLCMSMYFLQNPMILGAFLIIISLFLTTLISLLMSSWYGYILFIVYIGGLLVMFIYICMISSNYKLKLNFNLFHLFLSILFILSSFMFLFNDKLVLGSSAGFSSVNFPILLLILLGIYLMMSFFFLIWVIFSNGVSLKIEN